MRSLITTFAINAAHLTAIYLKATQLNDAIILADNFHNDEFYCLIQVRDLLCSQLENATRRKFPYPLLFTHLLWDVWELLLQTTRFELVSLFGIIYMNYYLIFYNFMTLVFYIFTNLYSILHHCSY
jgi:hypothetical protein